ncbi:MAG: glycosyltransferase [Bacilli bacterium]|nr:glycosyltransferase [Bacilli bacterium]
MFKTYSVLMTVYYKENPHHFRVAIDSIINQTLPTNDFVIVADGPLGEDLDAVLQEYQAKHDFIHVYRLDTNRGSGPASKEGFKHIKNEVLAKMDSDDIAVANRMERELEKINEGYDVVGGSIAEFVDNPEDIIAVRMPPQNHEEIVKFSRRRNPISNVTVMYKKSQIEAVGGYPELVLLEDYTLAIKLIQNGSKTFNLQEVMVKVRSNQRQMKRRGDKYLKVHLKKLRKYMLETKYITKCQYHRYNFEAFFFLATPYWLKRVLYKLFLRKKNVI